MVTPRTYRTVLQVCCAGFLSLALACAPEPVQFAGQAAQPKVPHAGVAEFVELPKGHAERGKVSSSCTAPKVAFSRAGEPLASGSVETEQLSGLLCSEAFLTLALKEKAGQVGANAIFAKNCSRQIKEEEVQLACAARVAISERGQGARVGSARGQVPRSRRENWERGVQAVLPGASGLKSVVDAFDVEVQFTRASAISRREPWPTHLVSEVALLPVSDLKLGDVVARCAHDCDRSVVREALRVAAGALGATDVVAVQCVRDAQELLCTGVVGAPLLDPRVVAAAR